MISQVYEAMPKSLFDPHFVLRIFGFAQGTYLSPAIRIQAVWRGFSLRRQLPSYVASLWVQFLCRSTCEAVGDRVSVHVPRRVFILFSDTGGGHRASAMAIEAALRNQYGERVDLTLADFMRE